jgi:prepilin-type N-terminal cleavage/methylation domain-containing protein
VFQGNHRSAIEIRKRTAFTLVELLVVITIIGILIALLLPAAQMAREAARQTQCRSNLKQIALAWLLHEETQKALPTGGWGYAWAGEPTRGFSLRQPGGWNYNVLPYMELGALHDLGLVEGTVSSPARTEFLTRVETPIVTFICPSRRPMGIYPYLLSGAGTNGYANVTPNPPAVGRCDYAASMGETDLQPYHIGSPVSLAVGDATPEGDPVLGTGWYGFGGHRVNGVVGLNVQVKLADITDGTSNTYMVGEKNLNPDFYMTGQAYGDNQGWDAGCTADNDRMVGLIDRSTGASKLPPQAVCQPAQDTPGWSDDLNFGSAHVNGFGMAMCDGSVSSISYTIDLETNRRLGVRNDDLLIDAKKL